MILDLKNEIDLNKFKTYSEKLIKEKSKVDLKKIIDKRTISQNSYLHVIIQLFAIEFGYTLDEAKTFLKRKCDFMVYEKHGERFLKKTSLMNKADLTVFIDWIRNFSSMNGLYLPTPEEYKANKILIDKEIDRFKKYI